MDEENLITPYLSFTDELNPFHTVGRFVPAFFFTSLSASQGKLLFQMAAATLHLITSVVYIFHTLAASIELYSSTNVITDPITGFKLSTHQTTLVKKQNLKLIKTKQEVMM
jgi:hypothetical protein